MAITTSGEYQLAQLYTSYMQEMFTDDISLMGSGIVSGSTEISGIASAETHTGTIRYYGNVNPTINVQDETTNDATPDKIATSKMGAIKIARSTSWSVGDLSVILANENGLVESARQAVFARAKNEQLNLIDIIFGVLEDNSDNDSGDMISNISKLTSGVSETANHVSRSSVVNFLSQVEGDAGDFIMVMNHSAYADLANLDETTLIRTSDNPMFSGSFMGVDIMVNNQVKNITSTATSFLSGSATANFSDSKVQKVIYFVRKGGFAYAPVAMVNPVGVDRNELAGKGSGTTDVVYRWGHVLHPLGYSYGGTTDGFATDALLKAGASWDRKWTDVKLSPVGALVFN